MKKFRVKFGIVRLDTDFDSIYRTSKFYQLPSNDNISNEVLVETDDIDELTHLELDPTNLDILIVTRSNNYEKLTDILDEWTNWLYQSKEAKEWVKSIKDENPGMWCVVTNSIEETL